MANPVIWSCPCGWWEFGRYDDPPDACPECGMCGLTREEAESTLECRRYHDRKGENERFAVHF
jgi:hypothetical protein